MASIYNDQHILLHELLAKAGRQQDASLLIPDLQRPFVWSPTQVINLVDSLIRGWPFGTLLTWKVAVEDPAREISRPFWTVVDRMDEENGTQVDSKAPPASFQLVLDGQQRVQSLLLAFGGDNWGFRDLDKEWQALLSNERKPGPKGKPHWSLGSLCVDTFALRDAYTTSRRAVGLDYTGILYWVRMDANSTSGDPRPEAFKFPLPLATDAEHQGRYVRLSRLWDKAPHDAQADAFEMKDVAKALLVQHGMPADTAEGCAQAVAALLIALAAVKLQRVTYLALEEYSERQGERDAYDDAIVNIFTRLNQGGRILTREDITFAWLKVGWDPSKTHGKTAKDCVRALGAKLKEAGIALDDEEVVASLSFMWSVCFNQGGLMNNTQLIRGEVIKPMAGHLSEDWVTVVKAVMGIADILSERDICMGTHFQSINAVNYLWAWNYAALRWINTLALRETERDAVEKQLKEALEAFVDRWLIGTLWSGIWARASKPVVEDLAKKLTSMYQACDKEGDRAKALALLTDRLKAELADNLDRAKGGVDLMGAESRGQVRGYYVPLWVWNRLNTERWDACQVQLRTQTRKESALEVDHIVAHASWGTLVDQHFDGDQEADLEDRMSAAMNQGNAIGNTSLLEKNFNISKSKKPLKEFLGKVHEFTSGHIKIEDWAEDMDIPEEMLDATDGDVADLTTKIMSRSKTIRDDLKAFLEGKQERVDLA